MTYDFNLLVSYEWKNYRQAKSEMFRLLHQFGDGSPRLQKTGARGICGIKTILNNRRVTALLKEKILAYKSAIRFTLKWTPIDLWCEASDTEPLKQALSALTSRILPGEKWMMHVEKRRYVGHHKEEIIKNLADLIHEKVDLKNPDKIVWIEIVGNQAGISIIQPFEIFSLFKSMTGTLI